MQVILNCILATEPHKTLPYRMARFYQIFPRVAWELWNPVPSWPPRPPVWQLWRPYLDCYTVVSWWHWDCQWGLLWLAGLDISCYCLNRNGLWFRVTGGNFHRFQRALTIPLHSPNGRQMPAVRGCARRLWKSLRPPVWQPWRPNPSEKALSDGLMDTLGASVCFR